MMHIGFDSQGYIFDLIIKIRAQVYSSGGVPGAAQAGALNPNPETET